MKNKVTIYTDGACKGNPGEGGWGAILHHEFSSRTIYGYESLTTNNRMELTAAIKSLSFFKEKFSVLIYTDSKYVMNGVNTWIHNWKKNNWQTANKKDVKNVDLWISLDKLNNFHDVDWKWVKGHSGNKGNEQADMLANLAISEKSDKYE